MVDDEICEREDDWEVDLASLYGGAAGVAHSIFGAPHGPKRAVVIYQSSDVGSECGRLAVLEACPTTRLVLNPTNIVCTHDMDTVYWLTPHLFAARVYVYDTNRNPIHLPFLLIDLDHNVFSFIPLDPNDNVWLSFSNREIHVHEYDRGDLPASRSFLVDHFQWCSLDKLDTVIVG